MNKLVGIILLVIIFVSNSTGSINLSSLSFSSPSDSVTHKVSLGAKTASAKTTLLSRYNFNDSITNLYNTIGLKELGLGYDAFRYAMIGYHALKNEDKLSSKNLISIIDFSKASTEKRFYTIDLDTYKIRFHSLVSHGRNTGQNIAKSFSNIPHSNQSSLGFYITGETYVGSKGYSLRLDGVDGKFNSNMRKRAVVMHAADYVSEAWIEKYGRLGRSQGCPALPNELSRKVIDTIKDKTMIFAYFKDDAYFEASAYLDLDNLWKKLGDQEEISASI
ncbi:MAG TPA: murein L,D-transpeptidase catalytic domain family protein [Ohtaekwangia sp.]|nr:murein L,D-transpeptidase catalytic domain family protein [Ohtaekwangia sp.]